MMIVWKSLDFWLQKDESLLEPNEMRHEIDTCSPNAVRVWVDCCEDVEQVLDVYVLRCDPLCFSEVELVWIDIHRHPGEVVFFGRAEE